MYAYGMLACMPGPSTTYQTESLLTTAQLSQAANISRATISRAVKAGIITPLRTPGGHFRFRRSDIDALLQASA